MIVTIHQHTVKGTSIETGLDVGMMFEGESVPAGLEPEFTTHQVDVPDTWDLLGPDTPGVEGEIGDGIWLWHPTYGHVEAWDAFLAATWGDFGFRLVFADEFIGEATS